MNRLRRHDPQVAAQITSHGKIVGFRNSLVHGYDTIDYEIVWAAIQDDLPVLRTEIESILVKVEAPSTNGKGIRK